MRPVRRSYVHGVPCQLELKEVGETGKMWHVRSSHIYLLAEMAKPIAPLRAISLTQPSFTGTPLDAYCQRKTQV